MDILNRHHASKIMIKIWSTPYEPNFFGIFKKNFVVYLIFLQDDVNKSCQRKDTEITWKLQVHTIMELANTRLQAS